MKPALHEGRCESINQCSRSSSIISAFAESRLATSKTDACERLLSVRDIFNMAPAPHEYMQFFTKVVVSLAAAHGEPARTEAQMMSGRSSQSETQEIGR